MRANLVRPRRIRAESLLNSQRPALFLIGALTIGVAGTATYEIVQWVLRQVGLTATLPLNLIIALFFGGGIWLFGWLIDRYLDQIEAYQNRIERHVTRMLRRGTTEAVTVDDEADLDPKRALIVFVSAGRGTSHLDAICYHLGLDTHTRKRGRLEYCWLFHTNDSEKNAKTAAGLLARHGVKPEGDKRMRLLSVEDNTLDTLDAIQKVIDEAKNLPLPEPIGADDLVVDFTGFMRQQAAAAVLACTDGSAILEYMQGVYRNGALIGTTYDDDGNLTGGTPSPARQVRLRTSAPLIPPGPE